jgi:protein phosphatase
LDYLHDNGISFGGAIDASCFALAGERAMWANFTRANLHPQGFVSERLQDTRALAFLVFHWLTGKNQYEHDPTLLPKVSQALDQALSGPGFASGGELAQALEQALAETSVAQAVDYHVGRRTDVGMIRTLNEDSMLTMEIERFLQSVGQPVGVYVVADGMGGHTAGEIASGAIVNTIAQKALKEHMLQQVTQGVSQDASEWLRSAVEEANKTVFELRKSAGTDMGSTLVSAVLQGNMAYIAHVGDSRAYMLNSQGIRQLTTDHSLVERLIATNQITREEARHHPQRNVIYRTIGDKMKVDVDISTHALSPGDQLLLCSDGLSGMVDDQTIYRIVSKADSPQSACEALIDAANAAGGDDNITVIIIRIIRA